MDRLLNAEYRPGVVSREQALYTIKEAARYIGLPSATLTTWLYGRYYNTKAGRTFWNPVLAPADPKLGLLSFFNLAEAHILAATRYQHEVPFTAIRSAIDNLVLTYPQAAAHPLLSHEFYTNGKGIFLKTIEDTVDISHGQLSLKQIMDTFLERIVRDDENNPFKVFPLVRGVEDKVVSIISGVASSRPIIDGFGVPVSVVWGRHDAGESDDSIAEDFEIPVGKIRQAIEYFEWKSTKAA